MWLKATYNLHLNHKDIQRLMSELGIKSIIRKKRPYVISDNHLNRDFHASRPNEKWVTEITYLIFNGQRLYLSLLRIYIIMRLLPMKPVVETT
ncbi:IS3 family transposase [Bacillus mycoides]|uniref:IS3 family transposase n=1 Tax=Bacillus mycoides TaxID=1405 RepID=UPI001303C82A